MGLTTRQARNRARLTLWADAAVWRTPAVCRRARPRFFSISVVDMGRHTSPRTSAFLRTPYARTCGTSTRSWAFPRVRGSSRAWMTPGWPITGRPWEGGCRRPSLVLPMRAHMRPCAHMRNDPCPSCARWRFWALGSVASGWPCAFVAIRRQKTWRLNDFDCPRREVVGRCVLLSLIGFVSPQVTPHAIGYVITDCRASIDRCIDESYNLGFSCQIGRLCAQYASHPCNQVPPL